VIVPSSVIEQVISGLSFGVGTPGFLDGLEIIGGVFDKLTSLG